MKTKIITILISLFLSISMVSCNEEEINNASVENDNIEINNSLVASDEYLEIQSEKIDNTLPEVNIGDVIKDNNSLPEMNSTTESVSNLTTQDNFKEETSDNLDNSLSETDALISQSESNDATQNDNQNIDISSELTLLSIDNINGKILEMWVGHDNEIVLLADKLHIFDVTKQSVVATSDANYPEFRSVGVYKISSGYVLIGDTFSAGLYCYIYDNQLNQTNKISVPNYFSGTTNITITPNGQDIIYFNNSKITKLNISSGTTSVIKDLSNTDIGELVSTNYISVSDDGKQILFTGQTMTNTESVPSYGIMNIDGSDLKNIQNSGYKVGDGAVFGGDIFVLPEDSRGLTGRLLLLNVDTLEERLINLSATKESNGRTAVSSNGKYFANGELKSNEYIIRIYNTSDESLISTTSIKDDKGEYFYRGSRIAINEDSRVCTVSLGYWHTEIDTKMYTWGF